MQKNADNLIAVDSQKVADNPADHYLTSTLGYYSPLTTNTDTATLTSRRKRARVNVELGKFIKLVLNLLIS